MKHLVLSLAAFAAFGVAGAMAQSTSGEAPDTPAEAPALNALQFALTGFHVNILQNSEGGAVSVADQDGNAALIAFLEPEAAESALDAVEGENLKVSPAPLLAILQNWKGPILFESSPEEITKAKEVVPEGAEFLAPVFFVTTGDKETRIKTPDGMIVPILPSYSDAEGMAAKLAEQGVDEEVIKIVPIEFAAVLNQIGSPDAPVGYRVFTHPSTIGAIQALSGGQ